MFEGRGRPQTIRHAYLVGSVEAIYNGRCCTRTVVRCTLVLKNKQHRRTRWSFTKHRWNGKRPRFGRVGAAASADIPWNRPYSVLEYLEYRYWKIHPPPVRLAIRRRSDFASAATGMHEECRVNCRRMLVGRNAVPLLCCRVCYPWKCGSPRGGTSSAGGQVG